MDQGRLPIARGLELDDDDVLRAHVIQQLMCRGVIDRAQIEARFTISISMRTSPSRSRDLLPLAADGLVEFDGSRIVATSRGRLMLRIIAMCFDRYLATPSVSETQPRHSRAL